MVDGIKLARAGAVATVTFAEKCAPRFRGL
jgi:hypothetical protein